jgi:hypothetical protein
MKRYFQHLNVNDDNFGMVTELDFIDNSDPTFILYHFKDGTKCNELFIGKLNDMNVYGSKEFAEISSPSNKWEFELSLNVQEKKMKNIQNANGEVFEIPDYNSYTNSKGSAASKYRITKTPTAVEITSMPIDNTVDSTFINNSATQINDIPTQNIEAQVESTKIINNTPLVDTAEQFTNEFMAINNVANCCINNTGLSFAKDGKIYNFSCEQLYNKLFVEPNVLIKEVNAEKPTDTDRIELNIDDKQKALIDNMIDMSTKEEFDIEMVLSLSLPPVSVYALLKSVYSDKMSRDFVNIIADRMNVKELKTAVASGLLAFYDDDIIPQPESSDKASSKKVKAGKKEKTSDK